MASAHTSAANGFTACCGASRRARGCGSMRGFRRSCRGRIAVRRLRSRGEVRTSRSDLHTVQAAECVEARVSTAESNAPQMSTADRAAAAAAGFLLRVGVSNCEALLAEELLPRESHDSHARTRSVRFNLDNCAVHDVIAYSEIYGLHPREFVFDKYYSMVPAAGPFGFVGIDAEDCDGTDEDDSSVGSDEDDFD